VDHAGIWHFLERRFDFGGNTVGESQFSFSVGVDSD